MSSQYHRPERALLCALGFLLIAGCATSAPKARFAANSKTPTLMRAPDTESITVTSVSGIVLAEYEKSRLADEIKSKLAAKQMANTANGDAQAYDIAITITRYEKGNAFARAMLAGLGQMHIDGDVKVTSQVTHEVLSEFTVEKTFAWGGIYGASTHMEDIEQGFSEGVANALTGQLDEKSKSTASTGATGSSAK
jgi:Domain of unknown function (DUF4410)